MRRNLALSTLTYLTSALTEVSLPNKSHDLQGWRLIPLLPQVFIQGEIHYILFANDDDEYVITVRGRFDNNNGLPVEADGQHRVGRGYFFQDATYGIENLDGFVTYWNQLRQRWEYISLNLQDQFYVHEQTDLDLTYEASNGEWYCETAMDPDPQPKYDEVICTRVVPEETSFDAQTVAYQPKVIVNAVGYKWNGDQEGTSQWVFGGQIFLDSAVTLASAAVGVVALMSI